SDVCSSDLTTYEKVTDEKIDKLEFTEVRAIEGLKEATIDIKGTKVNVAVANGVNNAKTILEKGKKGEKQFHLIEIMACPGGCVAGGGQPLSHVEKYIYPLDNDVIKKRQGALYDIDSAKKLRKAHENPYILELYKEFLGEPGSHLSHKLLHTKYSAKYPRGIK